MLLAIETLGYLPNESARALVRGTRSLLGVVTGNTTRYGNATTIQGIEEAARRAGLAVAITVVDDERSLKAGVDLMLRQPLAGAVVIEFDRQGRQALDLIPQNVPLAAVTTTLEGRAAHRILFDDRQGGREATEYLLALGHTTVHHVGVDLRPDMDGRHRGWEDALVAAGARLPPIVVAADWTPRAGLDAGRRLLAQPDVTAVLCANDEVAFGVMKAAQEAGRRLPDDLMVVGFDDHPLAAFWTPSLTTIGQDFAALGAAAVDALLSGAPVAGHESAGIRSQLRIRQSTTLAR